MLVPIRRPFLLLCAAAAAEAFAPSSLLPSLRSQAAPALTMMAESESSATTRRAVLQSGVMAGASLFLGSSPAHAKKARVELNANGQPESPEERKERIKKERKEYEDRRKEIEAKEKELMAGKEAQEAEMGSNLRGDYYYPTARKRYLPRVKRAYDELVPIKEQLAAETEDWDKIKTYAKGHGDVTSALKLYVSALGGGGLSINSKFMSEMTAHSVEFEAAYKEFLEGVTNQKRKKALAGAESMESALLAWREAGKPVGLTNADWGVGEIPDCKRGASGTGKMSACATGSSFGNANPNLYNRNIKSP